MTRFVRQRPRSVIVTGSNVPCVIVRYDNAIIARPLISIDRTRIQAISRSACCIFYHPNIQVVVSWPLNQILHFPSTVVGQTTQQPVNPNVAIPVGVSLR